MEQITDKIVENMARRWSAVIKANGFTQIPNNSY